MYYDDIQTLSGNAMVCSYGAASYGEIPQGVKQGDTDEGGEMKIYDNIETKKEYFWKKSDPWDWFGVKRWWEVFVEFSGLNGGGGAWIIEKWRWNGSTENIRTDIKSLPFEETMKIIHKILPHPTKSAPVVDENEGKSKGEIIWENNET